MMFNMNKLPVDLDPNYYRQKVPGRDLTIEETMAARFYRKATLIGTSILLILILGGVLLFFVK